MIRELFTKFIPATNPGSTVAHILDSVVHDDGTFDIVSIGTYDLQDYIDSFAESCSLQAAFNRFAAGDVNAFSVKTPNFGDFTNMPKTYAEFLQKDIDGRRLFDSLPNDIKAKFGNDFRQFVADSTTDGFLEKVGFIQPVVDSVITEPVIKEVIEK